FLIIFFSERFFSFHHHDAPHDNNNPQDDDSQDDRQKLIAESRKYRRRAQEAEARLSELQSRSGGEQGLAELRRLGEQAGQYERLVSELTERHAADLAEAEQRADAFAAQLQKVVGADRLKSALAARGVTRVDQAAYLLDRHVRVELADGKPAVIVVDAEGEPILAGGDPDRPLALEQFVEAWLAAEGAHFLPPSGDVGSGAYKGASPEAVDMAELEADPARRYAFIREHGSDEYLRRLGRWKRRQAARK
ncbi:hypothetical protein LCGC14_1934610, partial [marine sediment metagenome]